VHSGLDTSVTALYLCQHCRPDGLISSPEFAAGLVSLARQSLFAGDWICLSRDQNARHLWILGSEREHLAGARSHSVLGCRRYGKSASGIQRIFLFSAQSGLSEVEHLFSKVLRRLRIWPKRASDRQEKRGPNASLHFTSTT